MVLAVSTLNRLHKEMKDIILIVINRGHTHIDESSNVVGLFTQFVYKLGASIYKHNNNYDDSGITCACTLVY